VHDVTAIQTAEAVQADRIPVALLDAVLTAGLAAMNAVAVLRRLPVTNVDPVLVALRDDLLDAFDDAAAGVEVMAL
jgi:ABC-type amino acid transport substrate-binding protein